LYGPLEANIVGLHLFVSNSKTQHLFGLAGMRISANGIPNCEKEAFFMHRFHEHRKDLLAAPDSKQTTIS
jgi:hypothetical protein